MDGLHQGLRGRHHHAMHHGAQDTLSGSWTYAAEAEGGGDGENPRVQQESYQAPSSEGVEERAVQDRSDDGPGDQGVGLVTRYG